MQPFTLQRGSVNDFFVGGHLFPDIQLGYGENLVFIRNTTYAQAPQDELRELSSQKILSLWLEYEQHAETESKLGLLQKLSIMFRFNRSALKMFLRAPELVIPYLQRQFYTVRHILCPKCKHPFEATDLIAVTMWD